MKTIFPVVAFLTVLLNTVHTSAQDRLEDLVVAGIEDAKRFAEGYITPAADGVTFSLANGWSRDAEVKKTLKFEIEVVGNASFVKDKHQRFRVNTDDYYNLYFRDGSTVKNVATALGENDPDIVAYAEVTNSLGLEEEVEFTLPQGVAAAGVNVLPSAFLQGRLGIFKNTELKARYFPKTNYEDVSTGLYGFGLQHEITGWLPEEKLWPVSIAAMIGYTRLTAEYDFTHSDLVEGAGQRFSSTVNAWFFQAMASTRLPVINFYAGLGAVTGTSEFDMLGEYTVRDGQPLNEQEHTFTDPFSLKAKTTGARLSLGTRLKLGIVGIYAEYSLAEFNSLSAGIGIGI